MNGLGAVLAAYRKTAGRDAVVWEWRAADQPPVLLAASSHAAPPAHHPPPHADDSLPGWAAARGWRAVAIDRGTRTCWLVIAPPQAVDGELPDDAPSDAEALDALLSAVVHEVRRLVRERDGATHELAERYEEISLLYAIGELLGSTASVESVADTVLRELAQTVGAPRAALLLHEPNDDVLVPTALLGITPVETPRVPISNDTLLATRAFRLNEALSEDGGLAAMRGAPLLASDGGPVLAIPVRRTAAGGGESLGVVLLAGRPGDAPFSAGDRKLVTAVASQVGTAVHNARLVRASLEQEQLAREMQLANELQLKLLPHPSVVGPEARAAARVIPAESVGGDFYLLARLDAHRTGVVIGDVSGHGYQAALVMALAMSATAIHVQAVIDPAVALSAVAQSLADELAGTEMSITLFYGVIDTANGELRYANAGHPHAFVLHTDGSAQRLTALTPPLGYLSDDDGELHGRTVPWSASDRLLLFTDGVPDMRDANGARLGEPAVLHAAQCALQSASADGTPDAVVDRIVDIANAHANGTPWLDDLAVVVVERCP